MYDEAKKEGRYFGLYDVLQLAGSWANTGRFNGQLRIHNIAEISDAILATNKTIQFFYSLITVGLETEELIDRILSQADLNEININLKITLHKCLHLLAARGWDLSKHRKLIHRISSVCLSNNPAITRILENTRKEFKSPCISKVEAFTPGLSEPIGDRHIEHVVKKLAALFDKQEGKEGS